MQDYMYSIIGVLALIIHVIINPNLFRKEREDGRDSKYYRLLMLAVFVYYVTDAGWGLFAGLNNIPVLFLDTTVYFFVMAAAVVCCSNYIIKYLEIDGSASKALNCFAWIFFALETAALTLRRQQVFRKTVCQVKCNTVL